MSAIEKTTNPENDCNCDPYLLSLVQPSTQNDKNNKQLGKSTGPKILASITGGSRLKFLSYN